MTRSKRGITIPELMFVSVVMVIGLAALSNSLLGGLRFFKVRENRFRAQLAAESLVSTVASLPVENFNCLLRQTSAGTPRPIDPVTGKMQFDKIDQPWLSQWIDSTIADASFSVALIDSSQNPNVPRTTQPNLGEYSTYKRQISATVVYAKNPNSAAVDSYTATRMVGPLDRVDVSQQDSWKAIYVPPSMCSYSTPNVPSPRKGISTLVWTGREVIVWGGEVAGVPRTTNTGARYNPATDTWTPTSTGLNVPSGRVEHMAVWTGSKMIVWGGNDAISTSYNTGALYDPLTDQWTPMAASPLGARGAFVAAWTGSKLIIWGGGGGANFANGAIYDPNVGGPSGSWTMMAANPFLSARINSVAVWTGSKFIVWGGNDGLTTFGNGAIYDPNPAPAGSWVPMSAVNAPSARSDASAVWTGSEMIVWGGERLGTGVFNSGGRFDPTTANGDGSYGTWRPTSLVNAPLRRGGMAANSQFQGIWTGKYMVVWSGQDVVPVASIHSNGGYYDPLHDIWNSPGKFNPLINPSVQSPWQPAGSVSLKRAPPGTLHGLGVWTGSEVFVFGGSDATGAPVNTYGRYAP